MKNRFFNFSSCEERRKCLPLLFGRKSSLARVAAVLLMLMTLGVGEMWAEKTYYYLVGDNTDMCGGRSVWDERGGYEFIEQSGKYYVDLMGLISTTTYTFKVTEGSWGTSYGFSGNEGSIGADESILIKDDKSKNMKLTGVSSARLVFWLDNGTPKIKVTSIPNASTGTQVTDENLVAVLNGTKIMFYFGDKWNDNTKWLFSNGSKTQVDGAKERNPWVKADCEQNGSSCANYAFACVPSNVKYWVSHSSGWEGVGMANNAIAGARYQNYNDGSDKMYVGASSSLYGFASKSCQITEGDETCTIALSTNPGNSTVGRSQSVKYYYESNSNWYEFNPSNVTSLTAGTYSVAALVTDGNIYVRSTNEVTLTVDAASVLYDLAYGAADGCTSMGSVTAKVGATYETGADVVGDKVIEGSTVWFKAIPNTGYRFVVWCDKDGSNEKWSDDNPKHYENVTYNIDMYAKFQPKQTRIALDMNGGKDGSEAFSVNYGTSVAAPGFAAPTRSGYNFLGYYDDPTNGTKYYNADGTAAKAWDKDVAECTLYAHWQQLYFYIEGRFEVYTSAERNFTKDTYDGANNWHEYSANIELTDENADGIYTIQTYKTVAELSAQHDGHYPWFYIKGQTVHDVVSDDDAGRKTYTAPSSSDKSYLTNPGESNGVALTTTWTANTKLRFNGTQGQAEGYVVLNFNPGNGKIWFTLENASVPFNVTFDASTNGGKIGGENNINIEERAYANYVLPNVNPIKNGYHFDGWFTAASGGSQVTSSTTVTETEAHTIYAQYSAPVFGEVTVNEGASVQVNAQNITIATSFTTTPEGSAYLCYTFEKNDGAGNWSATQDIEVSGTSISSGIVNALFNAPASAAQYRVTVAVKTASDCSGDAIVTLGTPVVFDVVNQYTVTYGKSGEFGTLTVNVTDGAQDVASGTSVNGGSEVVFTISNLTSKYAVQGWYADAECTQSLAGATGYVIDGNTLTISSLNADASVYVRFYSPSRINSLTLKDETNASVMTFLKGEVITAIPDVTKGIGNKAYCWEVRDAQNNPVATEFTSLGEGKVSFSIGTAGSYTLTLTISDVDCHGAVNATTTTGTITVSGEHEYYIVGSKFWGDNVDDLTKTTQNSDNILIYFRPTLEEGEFYFGPMIFSRDYCYFRIYDKAKGRFYVGSNGGNWLLRADQEMPMIVANSDKNINAVDDGGNLVLNDRDYYLYIKDGKLIAKEAAPDLNPKTRLKVTYTMNEVEYIVYSNEVKEPTAGEQSEIISFFAPYGAGFSNISYTMQEQQPGRGFVDVTEIYSTVSWTNSVSVTTPGVYTAKYTWSYDEDNKALTLDIVGLTAYTGNYYVRSTALAGGTDEYLTNADNKMRYTDRATNNRFDYYVCKWCDDANQDVRFCVANTINPQLTEILVGDEYITNIGNLDDQQASVRFMYNSGTNAISRAYLQGATTTNDFLLLMVDPDGSKKVYESSDAAVAMSNTKFDDLQDWNYTIAEVYAEAGAKVAVRAKYKNKYQFFYGNGATTDDGAVSEYDYLIGDNESTGDTRYKMRIVYDFKVDRLVTGWIPTMDAEIDADVAANCDILIIREHNNEPNTIHFGDAGEGNEPYRITNVKKVYGVMQIDKDTMTSFVGNYGHKLTYWISFPFDVRVGSIFGINGYGTNWRIQKYNGARRAEEGWFIENESGFWETMSEDEIMHAHEGYVLGLSIGYFAFGSSEVWSNGVKSVNLYFPSMDEVGTISTATQTVTVPEHKCTIDRTFTIEGDVDGEGNLIEHNHTETDSHWNIIGIPSFQALRGNSELSAEHFYKWGYSGNDQVYTPCDATNFVFQPTMAYMVQYAGDLNWPEGSNPVSVIIPQGVAARHIAQQANNKMEIKLMSNDEMVDRTYITLSYDAENEFVLNEDLYKVDNPTYNIYSRTSNGYRVAANKIFYENQTIEMGGTVGAAKEYTIRMENPVDYDVQLLDREMGTMTNLNLTDYTVALPSGSFAGRFALVVTTSSKVVTGTENTMTDGTKVQKFLENGVLYIFRDGRIYDAQGRMMK